MCRILTRPFHGWIKYFYVTVLYGTVQHLVKHFNFFCRVIALLLLIASNALDVLHTFYYYIGEIFLLSKSDEDVIIYWIVYTAASLLTSVFCIWGVGNSLLQLIETNPAPPAKNKVHIKDAEKQKPAESKWLAMVISMLFVVISMTITSAVHAYLVKFFIVDCMLINPVILTSRLIIGGCVMPFILSCTNIIDLAETIKSRKKPLLAKIFTSVLCPIIVAVTIFSIWFATSNIYSVLILNAEPTNSCPGKENFKNYTTLTITVDKSPDSDLIPVKLVTNLGFTEQSLNCSNFPATANMVPACKMVQVNYTYDKQEKTIFYSGQVHFTDGTSKSFLDMQIDSLSLSCGKCTQNLPRLQGSNSKSKKSATACYKEPTWIFTALLSFSSLMVLIYISAFTGSMYSYREETRKRNKPKTPKTKVVVDEHGNERVLRIKKPKVVKAVSRRR